jgi:hypothetical protein
VAILRAVELQVVVRLEELRVETLMVVQQLVERPEVILLGVEPRAAQLVEVAMLARQYAFQPKLVMFAQDTLARE